MTTNKTENKLITHFTEKIESIFYKNSNEPAEKFDNAKTKILHNLTDYSTIIQKENVASDMKKSSSLLIDSINENNFNNVWDIFEAEFPKEERRIKDQHFSLFQNKNYFLRGYRNSKGAVVGFISYWLLNNNQIFIEHFAIKKEFQSYGYGSKIISRFINEMKEMFKDCFNIFLEVEDPMFHKDQKTCEKRIGFYKKNGFVLNEHLKYQQPSYSFEKKDISQPQLVIMSLNEKLNMKTEDFLSLIKEIYSK